jgi:predicted O-methyltransferase YrrM
MRGSSGMVDVHILSLKDNEVVQSNLERFPHIEARQSVNGFNKHEVIQEFGALGIKYIGIQFATYGMLANGVTKLKSIKHQIDNDIPYLAFIEDDMLFHDGFMDWLDKATGLFVDESLNLVRLHQWGEGYLTSLSGAKRIWQIFCDMGMVNNIDIQLNFQSGPSVLKYCGRFSRTSRTNEGDCLKTEILDDAFFQVSGGHHWNKYDDKMMSRIESEKKRCLFEDISPLSVPFPLRDGGRPDAMSTPKIRGIINYLAGKGSTYLEIGVLRGSSIVSAAHGNDCQCVGVDNFSQFNNDNTNEAVARERASAYENISLLKADCWEALEVLAVGGAKVDTYFYDGAHDYHSQLRGLEAALPLFGDDTYIIVDDINWLEVRQANDDFCIKHGYRSLFRKLAPLAPKRNGERNTDMRHPMWWNGIEIIKKDIPKLRGSLNQTHGLEVFAQDTASFDGTVVEIGAYAGESTLILSKYFSSVVAIDPWTWESGEELWEGFTGDETRNMPKCESVEEAFDANIQFIPNITKMKAFDYDVVGQFDDESLAVVYIDSIHTYESVIATAKRWMPKIEKGGYLAGHDFSPSWPGVVRAVDEISVELGIQPKTYVDGSWHFRMIL